MRSILALLLVVGVLAEDEECPDFDCPVKDGSFAVSTPHLVMIYKVEPRTLAHAVGITLASTSAQSNSIALLASTGTISSEEISVFWHQDISLSSLEGNSALTRTRQFVALWHRPLPRLPPHRPLTRKTKEIFSIREKKTIGRSKKCDPEACELPWCYCSPTGSEIPNGLQVGKTDL